MIHKAPRARLLAAGLAIGLLGLGTAAQGQKNVREVSGMVSDGHREPLRGAVVYLEQETTQTVETYLTDRDGRYLFKRVLGDADYRVWATFRGRQTRKHFLSKFDSATEKHIDFAIH